MSGTAIIQVLGSLGLVIGLIWLAARLLNKRMGPLAKQHDKVSVQHRVALSRTSSVVVVKHGDAELVLGVTESTITALHVTQPGVPQQAQLGAARADIGSGQADSAAVLATLGITPAELTAGPATADAAPQTPGYQSIADGVALQQADAPTSDAQASNGAQTSGFTQASDGAPTTVPETIDLSDETLDGGQLPSGDSVPEMQYADACPVAAADVQTAEAEHYAVLPAEHGCIPAQPIAEQYDAEHYDAGQYDADQYGVVANGTAVNGAGLSGTEFSSADHHGASPYGAAHEDAVDVPLTAEAMAMVSHGQPDAAGGFGQMLADAHGNLPDTISLEGAEHSHGQTPRPHAAVALADMAPPIGLEPDHSIPPPVQAPRTEQAPGIEQAQHTAEPAYAPGPEYAPSPAYASGPAFDAGPELGPDAVATAQQVPAPRKELAASWHKALENLRDRTARR